MKTPITEMFGIDVPILAFSHCRDVIAAVSKAGGMGVLGAVAHSPKQLEIDLAWIEEEVGDKPFGVDLIVICTDGRDNIKDFVTGTITEHVINHASCPVLVIPYPKSS